MEEQIIEIEEITPRWFILRMREFLLDWEGAEVFFSTGTGKIGGVLQAEFELAAEEQTSLKSTLASLGRKRGNVIKQPLSQALNAIKRDFKNARKTEAAGGLQGLIKKYMKEALAKIEKVDGAAMFDAYQRLCNVDMVYDLLTSELHRLDPVIGDLGCQWRAPFVLDLHDAVHEHLADSFSEEELAAAIAQYENVRSPLPSGVEILIRCERSETVQPSKKAKPVFSSKKMAPLHASIIDMCEGLESSAPKFNAVVLAVENFLDNIWLSNELPRPGFDPLDYIRLCKLLTANRIRTLDEFGLSGIQADYDVPDMKRTLGDCLVKMTNYSMAYMTYVCEESCRIAGLEIDEDGYARDPEDEKRVHIVGSALKLMKDARFWTLQKAAFYKTNVCYGPTRAIFTRQAQIGHPIIIDLRRLICTPDEEVEGGYRYNYNGGSILYFEPDEDGQFRYVAGEQLTEDQKAKVGMVCEACSMVLVDGTQPGEDDPDRILCTHNFQEYLTAVLNNCNIVDLIMYGLSSHPELTTQIHGADDASTRFTDDETVNAVDQKYLEATGLNVVPVFETGSWSLINDNIDFPDGVRPNTDLLTEKARFLSILPKFGATTSQYKAPVRGDRTMADRNAQTMPFAPIHIYGSTYNRKIAELQEAEEHIANNNIEDTPNLGLRRIGEGQCRPRANQ